MLSVKTAKKVSLLAIDLIKVAPIVGPNNRNGGNSTIEHRAQFLGQLMAHLYLLDSGPGKRRLLFLHRM